MVQDLGEVASMIGRVRGSSGNDNDNDWHSNVLYFRTIKAVTRLVHD